MKKFPERGGAFNKLVQQACKKLKKIIAVCLVLTALISVPFFRFHSRDGLVLVQTCESGGKTWSVTVRYKGDWVRKDIADSTSHLFDLAGGGTVIVNHQQKTFVKHSLAEMIAAAKAAMGQGCALIRARRLNAGRHGKKETVSGYDAEIYEADTAYAKFTCWMARLPRLPGNQRMHEKIPPDGEVWRPLSRCFKTRRHDGEITNRLQHRRNNHDDPECASQNPRPVDDSVFQLPEGYKEAVLREKPAARKLPPPERRSGRRNRPLRSPS